MPMAQSHFGGVSSLDQKSFYLLGLQDRKAIHAVTCFDGHCEISGKIMDLEYPRTSNIGVRMPDQWSHPCL